MGISGSLEGWALGVFDDLMWRSQVIRSGGGWGVVLCGLRLTFDKETNIPPSWRQGERQGS